MKNLIDKKNILWDFDGVILDSMDVRERGFREVLSDYPEDKVEALIKFHRKNGGLSRYVKFRYFLNEVLAQGDDDSQVQEWARAYSRIMRKYLTGKDRLIGEVVHFIKTHYTGFRMHVVSGSDEKELQYLCKELGIARFFHSIEGSPTPKPTLVKNILRINGYSREETCLVGDSINDYDAAEDNGIDFFGYNNPDLKGKGAGYISFFEKV